VILMDGGVGSPILIYTILLRDLDEGELRERVLGYGEAEVLYGDSGR
jgi:hypothetical protein